MKTPLTAMFNLVVLITVLGASACTSSRQRSTESATPPNPPAAPTIERVEPMATATAASTKPARLSQLDKVVAELDNSRVQWSIRWWPDETEPQLISVWADAGLGQIGYLDVAYMLLTGGNPLEPFTEKEVFERLVKAMNDPTKIAAAHCELWRRAIYLDAQDVPGIPDRIKATKPPAERFLYNFHGLAVELIPMGKRVRGAAPGGPVDIYSCEARIDPTQFPPLRARWQKRLQGTN